MTYAEFIEKCADIPKEQHSLLNICHYVKTGEYRVFGKWEGVSIDVKMPSYTIAATVVKRKYGLQIPKRNTLIFSHRYKGYKFALLQGFLPGSAVVDVSAMRVIV